MDSAQIFMRARDMEKLKLVVQQVTNITGLKLSVYSYVTQASGFFPANSEVITIYPVDKNIAATYIRYVENCLRCGTMSSGHTRCITYTQEGCIFAEFTHFKCNCCGIRTCDCGNIIRVPLPTCDCCEPYKCIVCLPENGCRIPLQCKESPVW